MVGLNKGLNKGKGKKTWMFLSGQGPTNFLIHCRTVVLSSVSSGKYDW